MGTRKMHKSLFSKDVVILNGNHDTVLMKHKVLVSQNLKDQDQNTYLLDISDFTFKGTVVNKNL